MRCHNCPKEGMTHTIKCERSEVFKVLSLGVSFHLFRVICPTRSRFFYFCHFFVTIFVTLGMYLLWLIAFTVQLLLGLNLSASFCRSPADILGSRVFDS